MIRTREEDLTYAYNLITTLALSSSLSDFDEDFDNFTCCRKLTYIQLQHTDDFFGLSEQGRRLHKRISFFSSHALLSFVTLSEIPNPQVLEHGDQGVVCTMHSPLNVTCIFWWPFTKTKINHYLN